MIDLIFVREYITRALIKLSGVKEKQNGNITICLMAYGHTDVACISGKECYGRE